jgi:protease-4
MKQNQLTNHLANQRIFACEANQLRAAISASIIDDVEIDDFYTPREKPYIQDGIGYVSIQGLLVNGMPKIYEKIGITTSYDTAREEITGLLTAGANGIVIKINSGGGSVNGAIELSRFIASLSIPTAAMIQSCACSAAYMIAASTNRIAATETAMVGNIGTILAWWDYSQMMRQIGIEHKAITNEGATLKSTFHTEPNEEQMAFLQESVNEAGATFRAFVEGQRPAIDPEVFRAGWYSGQRALALGLVDEII